MQAHTTLDTSAINATRAAPAPRRLVTDAPIRMFHALFALSFLGAYLTADGDRWRALHVTLGYTMAGLLAFRVLYGVLGPRQSGLSALWCKLSAAPLWLRTTADALSKASWRDINWRQGQNLLMSLSVVLLMALVIPLTLTGYATFHEWGDVVGAEWITDGLGEVHEFFGEALLFIVFAHLALIAGLSVLRRKNQALPMLTGRVEGGGPDLVKSNRMWLAVLLLAAVLGYGVWEWQQSPDGLIPNQPFSSSERDHHHHHGD